jgi:hypothetical protein
MIFLLMKRGEPEPAYSIRTGKIDFAIARMPRVLRANEKLRAFAARQI